MTPDARLLETRRAFDAVAPDYDGPTGNNELIQRLRLPLYREVTARFPPGSRLLDLGGGTGLDAAYLAKRGYEIVVVDWSPAMVERTRARVLAAGLAHRVRAEVIGIHELERLGPERFAGIYSNLGPLNCVPDLAEVAVACARRLEPGGHLVASVIGRLCPWEIAFYLGRGKRHLAFRRFQREALPVGLGQHTVWTRYYTPREFARAFAGRFDAIGYRALGLVLPPPYLLRWYRALGPFRPFVGWLDDRLGALPLARDLGDHFLMVLRKRE